MNTSTTTNELFKALFEAQKAFPKAPKDATNPHLKSKYADLPSIWESCVSVLWQHGIMVMQPTGKDGLDMTVTTRLIHVQSGEWAEASIAFQASANPQTLGSAVTYGRRYTLQALAGIIADDDDGNAASGVGAPRAAAARRPAQPVMDPSRPRAQPAPRQAARDPGVGWPAEAETVYPFGKSKGSTFKQLAMTPSGRSSLHWLADEYEVKAGKYADKDRALKAGARATLDYWHATFEEPAPAEEPGVPGPWDEESGAAQAGELSYDDIHGRQDEA